MGSLPRFRKKKTSRRQETFLVSRAPGFEKFWQETIEVLSQTLQKYGAARERKLWLSFLPRLKNGEEIECGLENAATLISLGVFSLFEPSERYVVSRDSSSVEHKLPFLSRSTNEKDSEKLDREVQKRISRLRAFMKLDRLDREARQQILQLLGETEPTPRPNPDREEPTE